MLQLPEKQTKKNKNRSFESDKRAPKTRSPRGAENHCFRITASRNDVQLHNDALVNLLPLHCPLTFTSSLCFSLLCIIFCVLLQSLMLLFHHALLLKS